MTYNDPCTLHQFIPENNPSLREGPTMSTGNWHHHHSYRRAQYQATHWLAGAQFLQMIFPKRLAAVGKKVSFLFLASFWCSFFLLVFFLWSLFDIWKNQHPATYSINEDRWSLLRSSPTGSSHEYGIFVLLQFVLTSLGAQPEFFSRRSSGDHVAATAPGSYTYPTQTGKRNKFTIFKKCI